MHCKEAKEATHLITFLIVKMCPLSKVLIFHKGTVLQTTSRLNMKVST